MNSQTSQYLQALTAFVQTATTATRYVQTLYSPEEPQPTSHIVSRLRVFFTEQLKPTLKGLDSDFKQEIRQLYGAHLTNLQAGYHGFFLAQSSSNPYTSSSEFARDGYDSANRSLKKYVDWATNLTAKHLARIANG